MKQKGQWGGYRFVGGSLALDFVNTVGYRFAPGKYVDYVRAESDFLEWARLAGLGGGSRHRIRLSEAVALREALYRILAASLKGARPRKSDTKLLNRSLSRARASWKLQANESGWRWQWAGARKVPYTLARVAESAAELLTSNQLALLRQCGDEQCGWLYLDRSQGRRRKWCSMQDCGNRAKVRRFFRKASA